MALDGIFLHKIKNEIDKYGVGCRVERVYQPSRDEVVLHLRGRNGAYKLLFSIKADSARVQFVDKTPENPATPPMLCMLLRKHLCGSILESVSQHGLDRILFVHFSGTDEIGDRTNLTLCAEIMGKHSNVILLREDMTVVDALKRVDVSTSSYRQILPGIAYKLPPEQIKVNLLTTTASRAAQAVWLNREKHLSSAVLSALQGVSPLTAREIAYRVDGADSFVGELAEDKYNVLENTLQQLVSSIDSDKVCLVLDSTGRPTDFCAFNVKQYGESMSVREYDSCSLLLSDFYSEKTRIDRIRNRGQELFKLVESLCERTAHRLQMQKADLEQCADREKYRIYAELIQANLFSLKKGSLFYDLPNYYQDYEMIRIPADPSLSPQQQSQKYYKEYRKKKTAEEKLTQLIEAGEEELIYLESVLDELTRSETEADLAAIRMELGESGYIKKRSAKQKAPKVAEPMSFVSPDGFKILIGRNNVQNDKLSLKTAHGNDMWLHTQKIPGSHVIIVSENETIPDSTVEYAAGLAAYYSKARQSALVPVDYTLAKNLKKPNGAKPGKVIYHVYNTIIINPISPE